MDRRGVLFIFGFIFLLSLVASNPHRAILGEEVTDEHNIYVCPNPSEVNVTRFDGTIHGEPIFGISTRIFKYPVTHRDKKITCIKVTDTKLHNTGGYPTITNGGVGSNSVTIQIKSQLFRGYNFKILILSEK